MCLFVCVFLFLCVCVCVSVSVYLCVSVCVSVCVSLCVYLRISVCLSYRPLSLRILLVPVLVYDTLLVLHDSPLRTLHAFLTAPP